MELTCFYHPTEPMRVISDESEAQYLLSTGAWFKHPTDAENLRKEYEKRISEPSSEPSVCGEGTGESKQRRRKKPDGVECGDAKD